MARLSDVYSLAIHERRREIPHVLTTNEFGRIIEIVGPTNAYSLLTEIISTILAIAIPVLLALWRRSASKSKLQSTLIDAMVRGINAGTEQIRDADTNVVKRAVKDEVAQAGPQAQAQLKQAVERVKSEDNNENGEGI